jgi:hypothetical protein
MRPPSLQSVLVPPTLPNGVASIHDGLFVARLDGSTAGQVLTLDNYSFVITPRVVSPFTTLVGKKRIVTDVSQGRMLLPYPPFEVLTSSPKERVRAMDNAEPYYVVMAKTTRLQALSSELYERASLSFSLKPRPLFHLLPALMDHFILESELEREDREAVLDSLGTLIMVDLLRGCLDLGEAPVTPA